MCREGCYHHALVDSADMAVHRRTDVPGKPSHNSEIRVVCFFSLIFSYTRLLVSALSPCQGRLPRRKYMNT